MILPVAECQQLHRESYHMFEGVEGSTHTSKKSGLLYLLLWFGILAGFLGVQFPFLHSQASYGKMW